MGRLRPRHLAVGTVCALIVAIVALALTTSRSPAGPGLPSEGPGEGLAAPPFELPGLQQPGTTVALGAPDGRTTVISFFASWCTYCRQDLGVVAQAATSLEGRVSFVGVDVADTRSAGLAVVRSAGVRFPVGSDAERQVSGGLYHFYGLPATVFVSGAGQLVHTVVGPISSSELGSWLQRAEA